MKRTVLVTAMTAALVPVLGAPALAAPNPSGRAQDNPGQGCAAVLANIERNPAIFLTRSAQGQERFNAVGEAFGCI